MILEKSVQAQFLIPMAVSLAFGILFSTAIILVGVPVGVKMLEGAQGFLGGLSKSEDSAALSPETAG